MTKETIKIPDIGGGEVDVIEVCVAVGDTVEKEQSLVVLESDKASMEIPSPKAGKVVSINIKEGASVNEGDVILELELTDSADEKPVQASAESATAESKSPQAVETEAEPKAESAASAGSSTKREMIKVPAVGASDGIDVIEVCVAEGDEISEGDSLIVLESDKASMEIPSPYSGKIMSLAIKVGDSAKEGSAIAEIEYRVAEVTSDSAKPTSPVADKPEAVSAPKAEADAPKSDATPAANTPSLVSHADVYAGPAVRKLAREFGLELEQIVGTGPRNRILKEDVQSYVKSLANSTLGKGANSATQGSGLPALPEMDFSQFGEIDVQPLSKLHKLTAMNMHRSWVNLPHVTQFDEINISELEDFRSGLKAEAERRGVKMTPLPFLLKAAAQALREYPKFNASLSHDGENMVYKKYINIGIAVDTPAGLMVPVIKDVDQKSLWQLAAESAELAAKAKDRKLKPADMQGGCFTISSLGNIGGTGFTPIINSPEVAIMGVSKLAIKPHWNGSEFVPRKMLPLSLSYDHRALNGVDAGQFFTYLGGLLSDIRRFLL